jgi:hypothetical protein
MNSNIQEHQIHIKNESESEFDYPNIVSLSKKTYELEDQYIKDKYKAKIESLKNPDPDLPLIFKYDIEELLPFYNCVLDINKEEHETEKMLKDKTKLIIYAQKYLFANVYDFETSIKFYTWILDEYKDFHHQNSPIYPDNKSLHKQRIRLLFKHEMFDECVYDIKKFICQYGADDWVNEIMNQITKEINV